MKLKPTNILSILEKQRQKTSSEDTILSDVYQIFEKVEHQDQTIYDKLTSSQTDENRNNFDLDLLETHKIFHINDIEKICVKYRLRFLDSHLYKAELPYEAISKIKALEDKHQISLSGFKIMAPSKLFKLANADDPLLFTPIGNGYYYLIHKWGNDLSPFRRIKMWPFINLENFIATAFVTSLLITLIVPQGFFMKKENAGLEFFILFIFMFKWILGMAIYYGFAKGKNFSTAIWKSRYYNA